MSVSKLWTEYSVQIGAGTYIDGVRGISVATALQTLIEANDGQVFGTFGSEVAGAPTARFTSLNLKAVLDAIGVTGLGFATGITTPATVTLWSLAKAIGGTNQSTNAVSYLFNQGILVPRRISARVGGQATIDAEITAYQTTPATTSPVTYSTAQSLPGNTPGTSTAYAIGPVELNGVTFDGLQSVDLDFGIGLRVEKGDADIYPSFVTVMSARPTVRLRGVHIDQIATLTAEGTFYSASQCIVYFKKRAEGGTYVANGTAQHVKFTLGKARAEVQAIDGDPKSIDILISAWEDTGGPTAPITVNTASAIT